MARGDARRGLGVASARSQSWQTRSLGSYMRTLQRDFWNGQPETLRELFALSKPNGIRAVCTLWSHMFGWEPRLEVDGTIVRTQVEREFATIEKTSDEWRRAMLAEGWT